MKSGHKLWKTKGRSVRAETVRVLLAALVLAGCGDRTPHAETAAGKAFPELRLAALADSRSASVARFRGQNVILNIWATWCEPCRREMPGLQRLALQSDPNQLEVVGIAIDNDVNLAREFLLRYGVTFQNFSDPDGRVTRDLLGVKQLPQTFLLARDGTVAARIEGSRDWASDATREMLEGALGRGSLAARVK